jgi:hypothetical protein
MLSQNFSQPHFALDSCLFNSLLSPADSPRINVETEQKHRDKRNERNELFQKVTMVMIRPATSYQSRHRHHYHHHREISKVLVSCMTYLFSHALSGMERPTERNTLHTNDLTPLFDYACSVCATIVATF